MTTEPDSSRRGVTDVFSAMVSAAFSRRGLRAFSWVVGAYFGVYLVLGAAILATVYAALGTLRFHRIVNTGCFVKAGTVHGVMLGTSGGGSTTTFDYKLRPHCNWFPLAVNRGALAAALVIAIVVMVLVGAAAYVLVVRLADRLGEDSDRRVVPTLPEAARAAGRLIGWSIVVYAAAIVVVGVIAAAFVVCLAVLPEVLTVVLGIAFGAGAIFVWIRYLVPWYVRAGLTLTLVFADDRPVRPAWRETRMRTLTAWKIAGILLVIGIVTGLAGQIPNVLFSQHTAAAAVLGALISIVVVAAQIGLQVLFGVMAARQSQRGWKA